MKLKSTQKISNLEEMILKTFNQKDAEDLKYVVSYYKNKFNTTQDVLVSDEDFYGLIYMRDHKEKMINYVNQNSEFIEKDGEKGWLVSFKPCSKKSVAKFFYNQSKNSTKKESYHEMIDYLEKNFYFMMKRCEILAE